MVRKIYVGNLPFTLTETALKDLFSQYGTVESVKIVTNAFDGRSKGFGFVEMSTEEEAAAAVQALNNNEIEGRSIRVDLARPKESRPNNSNGNSRRPSRGPRTGGNRFGGGMNDGGDRNNRW